MSSTIYPTVTFAQSLDGRIATLTGQSQWISSDRTRRLAHRLRRDHDGILVGIGTVRKDDPELTCRLVRGKSPTRVVLDSKLSIPPESKLVKTACRVPTIVICSPEADQNRVEGLRSAGLVVAEVHDDGQGNLDIHEVLQFLASKGLKSLLIEGGSSVITSFLRAGLVARLVVVTAPILIGVGIPCIGDLGVRNLREAHRFKGVRVRRRGRDLVWELRRNG
jgi:diaminohydroxyphosphoribosylaminopyrimidine deaminase/5-amino-6-(5-phosphoribosylamino)uracil reductase